MAKKKLEFKTGQAIVYPSHGVGTITSIEEQMIAGIEMELYVIEFAKDKMTLKVPTQKAVDIGMRAISSRGAIDKVLRILHGRARVKRAMWSRRAQEYEQKIHSGNLVSVTEVVRDLHRNDEQREQSYSERQLYEAALERLSREVAVGKSMDESEAIEIITEILNSRIPATSATKAEDEAE